MSKAKAKTKAEAAVDTDEAKLEFRYRTLLQHHLHLQKEVVSNKKKLQAAKHKRDILSAEIRFLKRRQRHLLKINSAQTEPEPQQVHPKKLSRKRNLPSGAGIGRRRNCLGAHNKSREET